MQRNWEDFAQAIILKAIEDYRNALKPVRYPSEKKKARAAIREIERFFRSEWFEVLTELDGETLIRKLKEERS